MIWLWIGLIVLGLVALVYWQLIIAEGTYLSPRVVAWTYDLVARRYDGIKQFQPRDESWFVAGPVLRALHAVYQPVVLDVATGTGRLPLALLRNHFHGQIVGLDLSPGMLKQARAKLQAYGDDQVCLIRQDASRLPFDDETFDAVTCLESLEFMPRPLDALAEMVRVLAPGGMLFVTNRVGHEARFLPGRAFPRPVFREALTELPLRDIEVRAWQVQYDVAIARKVGDLESRGQGQVDFEKLIQCPVCHERLLRGIASLSCAACEQSYPTREGIVHLAA
jgi:ubiquinone/menaquinone biosynthesis C-methylase UbiE